MLRTKARPASVAEILREEFLAPMDLSVDALAEASGLDREDVAALCAGDLALSAPLALILGRVFGNSADFWLNVQRRIDLWTALHSPADLDRLARARPLIEAA